MEKTGVVGVRWVGGKGASASVVLASLVVACTLATAPLAAQTGRASDRNPALGGVMSSGVVNSDGRIEFTVAASSGIVQVDASLDEDAWRNATRVSLPYETNPGNNTPAPVGTECLVTFDEDNLYLACEALDPRPQDIRAFITDRDDIEGHDRIVFTIDPFNDARRGFEFGVSALGVQWDAVFSPNGGGNNNEQNQGPSDPSWDAIWSSAGRITERGYLIEAAIPFNSLRFPSASTVQTWGFHVARQWPRSDRVELRSMVWDRGDACVLCQANLLTGFTGISSGRNLEVTPTFTSGRTDVSEMFPEGGLTRGEIQSDVGIDAMWGVTSDLTLNATINPDFSQVEADVAQLGVNDRFALFFPEKRPFFLEGADFFETRLQTFFSRTISDPRFGTKLTGKIGANALGAVVANDAVNRVVIPGELLSRNATLDGRATTVVGRLRRDVGGSSTVGAIYTGREGDAYSNHVGGVDGFFRLASALTARLQYLHSETLYPEEVASTFGQPTSVFGGDAADVAFEYDTRDWYANLSGRYVGDGFRSDAGFMTQVNLRRVESRVGRNFWGSSDDFYTVLAVTAGGWHNENLQGRVIGEGVWASLRIEGPLQSEIWVNPNLRRQYFDGEVGRHFQFWFGGSIRPSGSLRFEMQGNTGTEFDFVNGGQANGLRLSPSAEVRIGRRVDFRLSHTFQRLRRPDGEAIFRANLSQLRAVYNFSPRSFVRAVVQYRDTDRNPETHEMPVKRSESAVFTQLLFSYKLNPQSVVFVGYSDNRDAFTDRDLMSVPLTPSDRTLFLKLGYAFRP